MNKVIIYYGPKKDFENLILGSNVKTITKLAYESDSRRRELIIVNEEDSRMNYKPQYIENIVAYSDEYAGISESTIQNFISFISLYDVENLYLHNPPVQIHKQIERAFSQLEIIHHQYKSIDIRKIKVFNNEFSNHIIGQEQVKQEVLSSIYPLIRKGWKKPIVLMFYGPTGVGKTETAKFISSILNENLFRKQFSMFQNNEFASYLFGGTHTQNSFAKELLERESNVILLDEFDKANSVFHSAFYQMFDEGVFEDKNYSIVINKAIIICTSNYKSEEEMRNGLGEPIFSRFDKVIRFNPLTNEAKKRILDNELNKQYSQLTKKERNIINIEYIKEKLLPFSSRFSNVREIQKIVKDMISSLLLMNLLEEK